MNKFLVFICIYLMSNCAHAQHTKKDKYRNFSFIYDNDMLLGQDKDYTHGIQLMWTSEENNFPSLINKLIRVFPTDIAHDNNRYSISAGNIMYTPADLSKKELNINDRPYAGFIYGAFSIINNKESVLDNYTIKLGLVGPATKCDWLQKKVHKIVGSPIPLGWKHQIKNEPTINFIYERKWKDFHKGKLSFLEYDFVPNLSASIGNANIYYANGITFRLGFSLDNDYGPPVIKPAMGGSNYFLSSDKLTGYLFVATEAKLTARDIFLNGNTFRKSHSVKHNYVTGDIQYGIVLNYSNFRTSFLTVLRTKEFHTQKAHDKYSSFTIGYRYKL